MQPADSFFLARMAEHLTVAGIGMAVVWLGYRLFRDMPLRQEGQAKIALPGGVSILLSRIGPGTFFALFGTALIGYTASRPVTYEQIDAAGAKVRMNGAYDRSVPQSGESALTRDIVPLDRLIHNLAEIAADIDATPVNEAHIRRDDALRYARARIMLQDWDPAWGSAAAFAAWVYDRSAQGPLPQGAERAATIYRGGP